MLNQTRIQNWMTSLKTDKNNITNLNFYENQIWSVERGTGELVGDVTGQLESFFHDKLDEIKKNQTTRTVAEYISEVIDQASQTSWDASGYVAYMPISWCSALLSTVSYAQDGIAVILQSIGKMFFEAGTVFNDKSFENWSKYLIDFGAESFARTWTDDETQKVIDAWNSEHKDKPIKEGKVKTYIGADITKTTFVSFAQVLIAVCASLLQAVALMLMAKLVTYAYAKLGRAENDKYKVGLVAIFRSRIEAFYQVKLLYSKYANLVSTIGAGFYKDFHTERKINRVEQNNRRIEEVLNRLDKHEIPRAFYDSRVWHLQNNEERSDINYVKFIKSDLYRKRKNRNKNFDGLPDQSDYLTKQKEILDGLREVERSTVKKQVSDAKDKDENKISQNDKKDL